jgi:hypothetical protein
MNRIGTSKSLFVIICMLFVLAASFYPAAAQSGQDTCSQHPVYDATCVMLAAVTYSHEVQPKRLATTHVYDATGAMLASIVYSHEVTANRTTTPVVYDATGAMLAAVVYSHQVSTVLMAAEVKIPITGSSK